MTADQQFYLESVKLLRDWSAALIVLETALIGFLGTMSAQPGRSIGKTGAVAAICFLLSLAFGIELTATMPTVLDGISDTAPAPSTIYEHASNMALRCENGTWFCNPWFSIWTIRYVATLQGLFFVVGMAWLVVMLFTRKNCMP